MSVTFSEIAASAIAETASRPGFAGRRLVLSDLYGLPATEVYAALEPNLDADAQIDTGTGTHTMRALQLSGGRLLLPYLVYAAPGSNTGSDGFAATLRTQFLAGAGEERVLLILDPRPFETVLSATEDTAALPDLAWEALARRAKRKAASVRGTPPSSFIERTVREFISYREPGIAAMEQLISWLEPALAGTPAAAGRDLWKLGCFLSDPQAHTSNSRFGESAKLRLQLDERYASQSKPWNREVRKLLSRKRVPLEVIDRVVASAGPFGIQYEQFNLGDLQQTEGAPPPLLTDEFDPILGARAALREGASLVVWLHTSATELRLRLRRLAATGDDGLARWASADPSELELIPGQAETTLALPEAAPSGWAFGTLELRPAPGGQTDPSETLQLAVYRSDTEWFPAEDQLNVDGTTAGFACEDDPVAVAYGDGGDPLGRAIYPPIPDTVEDRERFELAVEFRDQAATLPVILQGEVSPDDPAPPAPPDEPDDPEPGPEDPPATASEHPSVPHALLQAGRSEWPDAQLSDSDGKPQVTFRIGARMLRISPQRPATVDGAALERAILARPEWTTYVWADQSGSLSRAQGVAIAGAAMPAQAISRFTAARAALFGVAAARGSIYAVDPDAAEVTEYLGAYAELLESVPREGRYQSDWDALLLCDAVFIAGERDLLFAPTSPLAVAFHAGIAARFASWVSAADLPPDEDIGALSLKSALPLVNARDQWYETAPTSELLWRRYLPLAAEAPGAPDRNARFIAQRLHFFLHVHATYKNPNQVLSIAFHQPGDGRIVFDALRSFYSRERSDTKYRLPRLHAHLVGASQALEAEVSQLLAGGRQDDLDRLVQSRVTVTATPADQPPAFAHVTFLFRSPGVRSPRHVPMDDRAPTDYLDGLAAAPGRKVYSERNQVFAWGTWARGQNGHETAYHQLLLRSLELVAGQPTGRLTPGWTQMASTSIDQEALDELYGERSVWVVHLDRLIGIEAFGGPRQLIEYEERADPDQPGYDGITATEQVEPYLEAVGRALSHLGDPTEEPLQRLLQMLNAVSGRWALELLQRGDNDILQRIGFVSTIAVIEQLENCLGSSETGTGVLVALDELIAGRPHAGLPRFSLPVPLPEGKMCDDLLVLWIPRNTVGNEPVIVRGAVIEVKYAGRGRARTDEARGEITRTREWLHRAFNTEGASRPFRARDLAELITSAAARATTFNLGRTTLPEAFDPALARIARGDYRLDLTHWRGAHPRNGIIASVEAESTIATNQSELADTGNPLDLLRIGKPVLRQLIAGARVRPAGPWQPISFLPPGNDDTPGATPSPITPEPQEPEHLDPATPVSAAPQPRSVLAPAFSPGEVAELPGLARSLDEAMDKYRLAVEPFQVELAQIGPNIIRFRTRPLGPLSVSDVERRARDIGREIGAPGAVIVSQEPRYICIDVPRAERQPVLYRDLVPIAENQPAAPGALNVIVGIAPSGEVRVADLARLPHLLVAGATGSGKSVFLRSLLCYATRTSGPQALRILLVDPKQLDFSGFASIPHLVGGHIISDPAEAIEALQQTIEAELERRRPILIEAGVTSATEFYERGGTHEQLSQMIVLVDEFADLAAVMDRRERQGFQELIQRYAQLTRAFGIYLVLATQRPSVDVISGPIKANLTARIALSLPSHRDSMTVLDRAGAEDLLGNGDLLFYVNGRVERLQAPFADASDVAQAAEQWRSVPNPDITA
jgi:hypothetical protein